MSAPSPQFLYTAKQAAAELGCSQRWLADQLRARRFPARKIARTWMFSQDDLEAIVALCAIDPIQLPEAAIRAASQTSSMTTTTARRLRRGDQ